MGATSAQTIEAIAEGGMFKFAARAGMIILTLVVVPAAGFFASRTLATLDEQGKQLATVSTDLKVLNNTVSLQLQDIYRAGDARRDHDAQKIINDQVDYRLRQIEQRFDHSGERRR